MNRKAHTYANPQLVEHLYQEFRTARHDLDEARQARNKHAALVKQVLTIEDDVKREEKMKDHQKIGKCMKKDIQAREKKLIELESQLVAEALKLPNKTHWDSPVGGEDKNKVIKEIDARLPNSNDKLPDGMTHVEIAR